MSLVKFLFYFLFRLVNDFIVATRSLNHSSPRDPGNPKVFFPGSISGNRGGPRVKAQRLKNHFSESRTSYDLVYVLSNNPHLNTRSLNRLKRNRIPIVLNQNGVYFPGWYPAGWSVKNKHNQAIYQSADYVFWQSAFARRSARQFLSPLDPPGEILYNAVDLNVFFPASRHQRQEEFRFLIAGNFRLSSLYQIEEAVKALPISEDLRKVRMTIAGLDKRLQQNVEILATKMGVRERIDFLQAFSQNEAPSLMRQCDAYLALKYMDTCPNLVIEALACGLPVVYSSTGGLPELIDETCGVGLPLEENWFANPTSPRAGQIAEGMSQVIRQHKIMSLAARHRAEKMFDIEHWYTRQMQVFQNFIERRNSIG